MKWFWNEHWDASIKNVENQAVTVALLPEQSDVGCGSTFSNCRRSLSYPVLTQSHLAASWCCTIHPCVELRPGPWVVTFAQSQWIHFFGIQMHKWHHSPWHKLWNSDGQSWVFQRMSCLCLGVKTWWRLMIAIFADSWLPFETFQDTPTYLGLNMSQCLQEN